MTPVQIAALAHRALMEELDATPKPGLVDRANSGAHLDMNHATFVRSADALKPHFYSFAILGGQWTIQNEMNLLAILRRPGIDAETAMYAATNRVNTHKGAIFSLGLLCAAAGRHAAMGLELTADALCETVSRMTAGICEQELGSENDSTAGQRIYAKYGALGARGEAESGFLSVRRHGLPVLEAALKRSEDRNTALVRTLISLIANVTDTNVLARRGSDCALWLRKQAGLVLEDFSLERVSALDEMCIAQGVSPGGCADLLAVTVLLQGIESA